MIFTQEQINEIKQRLALSGSKDPQLPLANIPLVGEETIAIIQGGENRRVSIEEFYEGFSQYIDNSERVDFFNVSRYAQRVKGDETSSPLTLEEAISICPDDIRRGGQVITFINEDGDWALWQYKGITSENWEETGSMWQNLESDPNLGITFTTSINSIDIGETKSVTLEVETIDGGKASIIEIYINEELFRTYKNIARVVLSTEVSGDTVFTAKATQYNYSYTETQKIEMSYPSWIGSGEAYTDVIRNANKHTITGTVDGSYDVTFENNGNLFLIIPRLFILGPVTMSGFDVPMEAASVQVINEVEYNIYMSSNQYVKGTHTFVVGTYAGKEKDLVESLQQDVAGLQTLIGEQELISQEQIKNLEALSAKIETLEEKILNTADEEDITLVEQKYKFADKKYDKHGFSGMGRVILRKNIQSVSETIGNVTTITRMNLLTQHMVNKANTIYIIQYDYDLNGQHIIIPENCILKFEGGSISNGEITGNNTVLVYYQQTIFDTIVTHGTFINGFRDDIKKEEDAEEQKDDGTSENTDGSGNNNSDGSEKQQNGAGENKEDGTPENTDDPNDGNKQEGDTGEQKGEGIPENSDNPNDPDNSREEQEGDAGEIGENGESET